MDELNSLKEEMAALKSSLDKEQIINKKLMRTVMRQNASWTNVFVKAEFIALPFIYIFFAIACAYFGISQWYAITLLILCLIDSVADLRTFRISPKIFSTCSMLEVRKILIKQKKERFIHVCVAFPLAIVWLLLFSKAMFGRITGDDSLDSPIYWLTAAIIGGIIGGIFVLVIYRKAQKTNDTLIDDLPPDM